MQDQSVRPHQPHMLQKTIVTILSISYSGSHYLSLLLGSHSQSMHLGEVYHLGKARPPKHQKVACSICKGQDRCPIFHGIGPQNINAIYDIIYSRVDSTVMCLIDTSKNVRWAEQMMDGKQYKRHYIHLIRDPRALIRRWAVTYTTAKQRFHTRWKLARRLPFHAPSLLFGRIHDVYLYNWLLWNQAITQFIQHNQLNARVVTYRDLARNAPGEVSTLMDWIGLKYEPTQLEYWNFKHHGSQKSEYEWVKKNKTQFIDLRWQTELPESTILRTRRNQQILNYLDQIGLAFTEDGLTRHIPRSTHALHWPQ
jgi:hypothetical protein